MKAHPMPSRTNLSTPACNLAPALARHVEILEKELEEANLFIKGVCDAAEEKLPGIQNNQEYDPEQRGRDYVRLPLEHAVESLESQLTDAHERAETAERGLDALIGRFHTDDCPVECGFDAPVWCQLEEQCGDWSCDFGVEDCWRQWAANQAGEE